MSIHKPVLLKEILEGLNLKKGNIVVDATLGGGGHGREILKVIRDEGILIGIDLDIEVIKNFAEFPSLLSSDGSTNGGQARLPSGRQFPNKSKISIFKIKNTYLVNDNFTNLNNILRELKIEKVDAVLADLGISSDQIKSAGRGFSFQKDDELDMRMDQGSELTAKKIVNTYSKEDLKRILREYGEEKYAGIIAGKIVEKRRDKPLMTTFELVRAINEVVPEKYKHQRIHQATKTFQALRIEVNGELKNLEKFVNETIKLLSHGGRLAIISFHSLEDRIIKNIFRENARGCICPPASLREALRTVPPEEFIYGFKGKPIVKIITKKPITPNEKEVKENSRSRSAKLRIIEKI